MDVAMKMADDTWVCLHGTDKEREVRHYFGVGNGRVTRLITVDPKDRTEWCKAYLKAWEAEYEATADRQRRRELAEDLYERIMRSPTFKCEVEGKDGDESAPIITYCLEFPRDVSK
jgi:hypothetical protein